jgi:hypothetical protein
MIERRVPSDAAPIALPQQPEACDRELWAIGTRFGDDAAAGTGYPNTIP